MLVLLLSALLSAISLVMLMMAGSYTHSESYSGLLRYATQSRSVALALDLSLFIYGVGSVTSLFVLLGDFIPAILQYWDLEVSRSWVIVCVLIITFPFSLPRSIGILRWDLFLVVKTKT